jgi:hypothetical protein
MPSQRDAAARSQRVQLAHVGQSPLDGDVRRQRLARGRGLQKAGQARPSRCRGCQVHRAAVFNDHREPGLLVARIIVRPKVELQRPDPAGAEVDGDLTGKR